MTRLVAGALGTGSHDRLEALAASGPGGSLAVERLSAQLAVVVERQRLDDRPEQSEPRCLLDGALFDPDALGARLGLAGGTPEAKLLAIGFKRDGESILAKLRGNFVALISDHRRERVLLACDQLGARSLFFKRNGGELIFATEAHLLLRLLPSRPGPDHSSLVRWLADTSILPGRTLYSGVERLGGGRLLAVERGRIEERSYWAPRYTEPARLSQAEAAVAAREELAAAVRRQVPADSRCGVLLSGGLDSTSVAALARTESDRTPPPRAYSALFPQHDSIDESELIAEAAGDLERTSIAVHDGSMVRGSLEYLQRWELPLQAPNHFLWQPLLERAASEGTTVMLDGEGGDELWKFSPYLLADRLTAGRLLATARLSREMLGADRYRGWRSTMPYLRLYGAKGAIPLPLHRAIRRRHSPERYAPRWFNANSAQVLFENQDQWAWKRHQGPRWWAYMADLLTSVRERLGVGDYLRHRAAMAGLDARHPLIDLDLVEFALGLPPDLAIDADLERPVLREAIAGLVPDSIRLRPGKSYFSALFHDCLEGRDARLIHRLLDGRPEIGRYVDLDTVRHDLLDELPPGARRGPAWPWSVWRLVTAECWLRSQGDESFVPGLLDECEARREDWALSGASS